MKIGIRIEDKNEWERRTPIVPDDAKILLEKGFEIFVQSSKHRSFTNIEYSDVGVPISNDMKESDIILGIKEIPKEIFEEGKIYLFFAHVIKGQSYNMPMLKKMIEKKVTLIDYEKIEDENKRRLIFFGKYAGLAGMINSLWTLGKRLEIDGYSTPFSKLKQAMNYKNLEEAKGAIKLVGEEILNKGLPKEIHPLVIGFAGYGNVSKGAQEIFDILPYKEVSPKELAKVAQDKSIDNNVIYKVVFKEKDSVKPKNTNESFDLQDYYKYGLEKYEDDFEKYLDHLTLLVNANYWDSRYPRILPNETVKKMWDNKTPKLIAIGDISCDPDGSIQCTVKPTYPGNPVYVYDVKTGKAIDGFKGNGPVVMAVEILPTEIPRESSTYFSSVLREFLPSLIKADYNVPFTSLDIPPELKRAVILYNGVLTPEYEYIKQYLK